MGVTYKLTDDIVQFIIDEKHKGPLLSCRELVDKVSNRFQRHVSKSSVNDILREAQITSRRGRKAKDKFEIPAEKKAQLLAGMPDVSKVCGPLTGVVAQRASPEPVKPPVAFARVELMPFQAEAQVESLAEVLLQAAFIELFPRPWKNITRYQDLNSLELKELQQEWAYRTLAATSFKIELESGSVLYLDSRWQSLQDQAQESAPEFCPIERALTEVADGLLNNIQPIVIRDIASLKVLGEFMAAMDGKKLDSIAQITVLDRAGRLLAHFGHLVHQRREFISGVDPKLIENEEVKKINPEEIKEVPVYTSGQPLLCVKKSLSLPGFNGRAFLVLDQDHTLQRVILTNASSRTEDAAVVRLYTQRHPAGHRPPVSLNIAPDFSGTTVGDYLKNAAARTFFPQGLADNVWHAAMDLKGQGHANEDMRRVDFAGPASAVEPALIQAMERFNIIYIKDINGKPVWLNIPNS